MRHGVKLGIGQRAGSDCHAARLTRFGLAEVGGEAVRSEYSDHPAVLNEGGVGELYAGLR
ncbi:MAG: hypothetical protein V8T53_09495 [Eubacteriales bacterium]